MKDVSHVLRELDVNYRISNTDRDILFSLFSSLPNPYTEYEYFYLKIKEITDGDNFPSELKSILVDFNKRDFYNSPFYFIENCPIDEDVPLLDNDDPVFSKYERKKTFISEGFLACFSYLTKTPIARYKNANNGDAFHDIFTKNSMKYSQSQKAFGEIYTHKDLANHYAKPNFVNILTINNDLENLVYTTFIKNKDVIEDLNSSDIEKLSKPFFVTPHDDLPMSSNVIELGEEKRHKLLNNKTDFVYFETRTMGVTMEYQKILNNFKKSVDRNIKRVSLKKRDFVSIHNDFSIHGKNIVKINNYNTAVQRWLIKSLNLKIETRDSYCNNGYISNEGVIQG